MIKRNPKLEQPTLLSTPAAVVILLNYFVGFLFVYPLIGIVLTARFTDIEFGLSPSIGYAIMLFTIAVTVIAGRPLFAEEHLIQINTKKYTKKIFITFGLMYLTMLAVNPILAYFLGVDISENQASIIDAIQINAPFVIFSAVIMAPIVEEIVFRGVLYRKLRTPYRYLSAIMISSVSFGLMHVSQSLIEGNLIDLPFMIVYVILGLFFVKIYEETGKLSAAIWLHGLNNIIGIGAIMLSLYLI